MGNVTNMPAAPPKTRKAVGQPAANGSVAVLRVATVVFLLVPIGFVVAMSFDERDYLGKFPPPEFSVKWYIRFFNDSFFLHGIRTSVSIAVLASLISTAAGLAASIALHRFRFFARNAVMTALFSPVVVPAIVIGFGLLLLSVRWSVHEGFVRLLCGHVIITLPYPVRATLAGLVGIRRSYFEAAQSLGATEWIAYWRRFSPGAAGHSNGRHLRVCLLARRRGRQPIPFRRAQLHASGRPHQHDAGQLRSQRCRRGSSPGRLHPHPHRNIGSRGRSRARDRPRSFSELRREPGFMGVVEFDGVSKAFGTVVAIDRITFTVSNGEIVAILGPSGCGKSTTLRLIAGFETPDQGVIRLAGKDVRGQAALPAQYRAAFPRLCALSAHDGARKRLLRHAQARHGPPCDLGQGGGVSSARQAHGL
jgi:ABC-type multidrug transport system fused ATPase/permease subunit